MSGKYHTIKFLLAGTASLFIGLTAIADQALSAPVVNGTAGCIARKNWNVARMTRRAEKDPEPYFEADSCGGSRGGWTQGNFVSATEINTAFQQQETYINQVLSQSQNDVRSYVDQRVSQAATDLTPLHQKNSQQDQRLYTHDIKNGEQDSRLVNVEVKNSQQEKRLAESEQKNDAQDVRLDDHETRISAVEQKNAEQDARLDDHDRKLAGHEGRIIENERKTAEHDVTLANHEGRITKTEQNIRDVSENAVFYDRDAKGNKTGGLTLNDGTGKEVQLRNIAAGKAATDAVNVGQLSGALDALGGGAKVNEDGTITRPVYKVGGIDYNNVGEALTATNRLGVQYVADKNGNPTNTVVLTGDGTGPVRITNVAAGTADTDAANVGQVKKARQESFAYTDERIARLTKDSSAQFAALSGEISKTRSELRAGVASAMAMAGLRFDDRPGKLSIAGGMGGFRGSTSTAAGLGYTSEDGNWRINAGIAHSFATHDTSWNAGASFTLN